MGSFGEVWTHDLPVPDQSERFPNSGSGFHSRFVQVPYARESRQVLLHPGSERNVSVVKSQFRSQGVCGGTHREYGFLVLLSLRGFRGECGGPFRG